jgi:hypothetical protein
MNYTTIIPNTPMKQEFNANRMAAKKEITQSLPTKANFNAFEGEIHSDLDFD